MAYSLGDPYRPLRTILRLNGIVVGWAFGLLLALLPRSTLANAGLHDGGDIWPLRLAGVAFVSIGLLFILSAGARSFDLPVLVVCSVFHALCALVLLVAYLQRELAHLSIGAQIILLIIFLLCLAGALAPMRYFRAEYQL
jgi:hypothetical protein